MDLMEWQRKCPWEKRTFLLCSLFYLCLLLQEHVTVADAGYRQESKNDIQDSSKLDSLSNYLPYDSKEDSEYKRGSGFYPLRGKKPSPDGVAGDQQLFIPDDLEDKRSQFFPLRGKKVPDDLKRASYFMPMRGRKDDGWTNNDYYDITDEYPNKRASSFMPMRGKKRYDAISDYLARAGTYSNGVSERFNPTDIDSYQSADKRLHSFVPVRGKRSFKESESSEINNSDQNDANSNHSRKKRAVSFMPMRGRRDFDGETSGDIVTSLLEKKKYSFMPMRGRREYDFVDYTHDFDKKATFMPMRGRKNSEDEDLEESKRAQYFMPMRGRRTHLRDIVNEGRVMPDVESRLIEDKRGSSFMPMRGRRSVRSVSENAANTELNLEKMATSFMPMRDRRSTDYLEKDKTTEPKLEKRATFMPMRGRRLVDEEFEVDPGQADQLMSLLNKKAVAFMPMRGRRFVEGNFTVEPWQMDQLMSIFNKKSFNKRASFMPMRGRKSEEGNFTVEPWQMDQLMSIFNKKSFNKKATFMPMRGRKSEEGNFTVEPWQMDELMSLFNKKSAFMPMRGRKSEEGNFTIEPWQMDQLMSLFNKKASFLPMRGRKSEEGEDSTELENDENDDKRSSSFMPMRGRRGKEMNFYNPYPYLMAGIGSSLMSKPYSDVGVPFNSVRSANERRKMLRINWDAVKRAFHATRGKRLYELDATTDSSGANEAEEKANSDTTENSRVNTRSKRSILRSSLALHPNRRFIALKRPMSFFATRGKRMDDSAIDKFSQLH